MWMELKESMPAGKEEGRVSSGPVPWGGEGAGTHGLIRGFQVRGWSSCCALHRGAAGTLSGSAVT